jgi:predicted RNA-binding protein associated with RNAse of E/G family
MLLSLHKVERKLIVQYQDEELCLAAEGYLWLQQFPLDSNFCVTTMLNQNHEVVQRYIDISRVNGVSDEGIPYWDDLYLDVIVLPDGSLFIQDEDELEEALRQGHIEFQVYKLAKVTAAKMINNSIRHFWQLINL